MAHGERKLLDLVCSYCGKEFQGRRSPSNLKSKTYCSYVCRSRALWSNPNFHPQGGKRRFPPLIKSLDQFGLGYISAFLDGEGTIRTAKVISKNKVRPNSTYYSPQIAFHNSDKRFLEKAQSILGCGSLYQIKPSKASYKLMYSLIIHRLNDVISLLQQLLPYLIVKKAQAETILLECRKEVKS